MEYQFITSSEELAEACHFFLSCKLLAVDTEFKRETTYFPKPCLIQLAGGKRIVCIDPFNIEDLQPLRDLLCSEKILKILHAGRQDIEVFHQLLDCSLTPIFDTQIAAGFAGYSSQIGYSALVNSLFGIELDKSLTRTDWEKRPLSTEQLDYAAADVEHLEEIYNILRAQLIETSRLEWLQEDIEAIFHDNIYQESQDKVWSKMCHSAKLDQSQRATLYALNHWRENEAKTRDRARQFVISNEILTKIAIQRPQDLNQLTLTDGIPQPVINRYSSDILNIINDDANTMLNIPDVQPYERLNPEQSTLLKKMKSEVNAVAAELNIENSMLCNKKTLENLIRNESSTKLFDSWRYAIIGKRLQTIMNN